jgi:hypothetical protein
LLFHVGKLCRGFLSPWLQRAPCPAASSQRG